MRRPEAVGHPVGTSGQADPGARDLFEAALTTRISTVDPPGSVTVTASQMGQLFGYYELLRLWNRRVNLTALSLPPVPPIETLDRLFMEPLLAAQHVPERDHQGAWLDFGSGGGSPAVPLKIVRPSLELTLVESRAKKVAFLREVVRGIALRAADVCDLRVEDLLRHREQGTAAMVTVRGLKLDGVVFSVAAGLIRPGGRMLVFGAEQEPAAGTGSLFRKIATQALPSSGFLVIFERTEN